MDWTVLITAAISGAGAAGIVVFAIKKFIERAITLRFDRLSEKNRVELQESIRRQAFIYDRSFEAAKEALSVVYRARNTLRKLLECIPEFPTSSVSFREHATINDLLIKLKRTCEDLYETLYEDHSVMARDFFRPFHALKNIVENVLSNLEVHVSKERLSKDEVYRLRHQLLDSFEDIEHMREALVETFQSRFLENQTTKDK